MPNNRGFVPTLDEATDELFLIRSRLVNLERKLRECHLRDEAHRVAAIRAAVGMCADAFDNEARMFENYVDTCFGSTLAEADTDSGLSK